jgi:hypothetical protein
MSIVLLGLIGCWLALNVAAGAFLILRNRAPSAPPALRTMPQARRIVTAPGADFSGERLRSDAGAR